MKIVGLVGESGTGKSTVAGHLKLRGAAHIDADAIVHELLESDDVVRRKVRERFGNGVFAGGKVDRRRLGAVAFADREALDRLNRIIHPAVIASLRSRLEAFERAGFDMAVVDAALLLDVPLPFGVDLMIALTAPRDEQLRRLLAKGGATREEIDARLGSQVHLEKTFYKADAVVDTNRSLSEVLDEIDALVDAMMDPREDG